MDDVVGVRLELVQYLQVGRKREVEVLSNVCVHHTGDHLKSDSLVEHDSHTRDEQGRLQETPEQVRIHVKLEFLQSATDFDLVVVEEAHGEVDLVEHQLDADGTDLMRLNFRG
tara:strand:- start:7941 stop:8279 length:339 start_codon:yes stop_codon:yes gene_type:complete